MRSRARGRIAGAVAAVCAMCAVARADDAAALSPQQVAEVAALARAAAVIRYLHPSDQAAALDWDRFLPLAIGRVRRADSQAALLGELRAVFAPVAPTAVFSAAGAPAAAIPLRGGGDHLVRWRRYGPGAPSPYPSFREGRDDEREVAVSAVTSVRLAEPGRCGAARVNAVVRATELGTVDVVLRLLRPGQAESRVPWPVSPDGRVMFSAEVPPDTQAIQLGVQADGRAGATLESLTLTCSETAVGVAVDPASPSWRLVGPSDLYSWRVGRCARGPCATLARRPLDRSAVAERDLLAADLGSGIRIDLPLAVWADGARTLPALPVASLPPALAGAVPDERDVRLAAVAATWGALSMFYPYFADQRIDWLAALAPAIAEAGAARSEAETRAALRHLLAELRDGHARLIDRSPGLAAADPEDDTAAAGGSRGASDGILPIALRRIGDRIAVTGGATGYLAGIAAGSELVALDGVPARAAYERTAAQVSAATEGLRAYLAASYLGAGPPGTVREVVLRSSDGSLVERALPLVRRDRYDHAVRPVRPWPGTELAPGVIYVDFDDLAPETWTALLPALAGARALIFDFRGYSITGLTAVSHLIDRPVEQLAWQIPQLPHRDRPAFATERRLQYPIAPRLTAPVVALVDGQSASTVETTLALLRGHHLGMLVGETTAGTSGLISSFTVPGGYAVRFTAIRLAGHSGATLHGRGLAPDLVVHPTLDGIRDGRDEILDAGLAAAQRLIRR